MNKTTLYRYVRRVCAALMLASITASCANDDYLNVIPKNSTALIAVDVPKAASEQKGMSESLMKAWFHVSDASDCGIDLNSKVYLFEAPDGNLGMVTRVDDEDDVADWLDEMARQGRCQKVKESRGCHFTVLNKSWVAAFNDKAFLVMGPAVSQEQAELMRKMMKYLEADEGVTASPLFARLEETDAAVAMVAQAQALPAQFVAPFTLGAPANTPPDKVLIAAEMKGKDGCLTVQGETFSFDAQTDAALKAAAEVYRPMKGLFLNQIPADVQYGLLMNIDGRQMLPLMKQSEAFRALLAGMSVKIDVNGFIDRVDGDLLLVVPKAEGDKVQMGWAAEMRSGALPLDEESEAELSRCRLKAAGQMLPPPVLAEMKASRMSMLVDLQGFDEQKKVVTEAFTQLLKPLFGEVRYVMWTSR